MPVLEAAGYSADQIDRVVITHMHGDHIGGLLTDGAPTFPNASYVAGQTEFDHWAGADSDGFEGNVRPLADQFELICRRGRDRLGHLGTDGRRVTHRAT